MSVARMRLSIFFLILLMAIQSQGPAATVEHARVADLNGEWRFEEDPEDVGVQEQWFLPGRVSKRTIPVPTSWQVVFEDLRRYVDACWYERTFDVAEAYRGKRIAIRFMGVDWSSRIWVNGEAVGAHEGGFDSFVLDITHHVKFDAPNTITVRVQDFAEPSLLPYDSEQAFMRMSGIWRQAWVEATGPVYVSDIFVQPKLDPATAEIQAEISRSMAQPDREMRVEFTVQGPDGRQFSAEQPYRFASDSDSTSSMVSATLAIDDPQLWDLDTPQLYRAEVRVLEGKTEVDVGSVEFGMREIELRDTEICLNGRPIYLAGGLDFVDYPDRNIYLNPYHPWTDDEIKAEILRWKEMGFNYIRKYGMEDERYIRWCDRLGMLVMAEPPFFPQYNPETMRRWEIMLDALVRRDRNHPSVIIWTLFNEGGGFGGDVENLHKYYHRVKALDPTRPIIDNSGGIIHVGSNNPPNNHPISDIEDIHYYYGLGPEWYPHNRDYLAGIEARERPVIITEMLALTYLTDMEKWKRRFDGKAPWWFNLPQLPGDAPDVNRYLSSADYEQNYTAWLARYFKDLPSFSVAHEKRNFHLLKYELEQIRKNPNISGYTYTQMNQQPGQGPVGILGDYGFGEPRVFQAEMPMLNSADLVFCDWQRLNYWTGEYYAAPVVLSHYGREPIVDATLKWSLEGFDLAGEIPEIQMKQQGVANLGRIRFKIPETEQAQRVKLHLELVQDGRTISRNWMLVNIFPLREMKRAISDPVALYFPEVSSVGDPMIVSGQRIAFLGIQGVAFDMKTSLTLTNRYDANIEQYLNNGGTVLLAVQDPQQIGEATGLLIGENVYYTGHGGWPLVVDPASGLFDRIPYDNPIDWLFYRIYTRWGVADLKPENLADVPVAGYGPWFLDANLRMGARTARVPLGGAVVQFRHGKGRLVLTTLRLLEAIPDDPVASIVLQDLLRYCTTDFQPQMELPAK